HRVMRYLVQRALLKLQSGRQLDVHGLALYRQAHAPMSHIDEVLELVEREEMAHAVAEVLRDIAGVVAEGFRRVARLPAAFLLQRLRQIPMIKRGEGLDAGGEQLVDEPLVEIEAVRIRLPRP